MQQKPREEKEIIREGITWKSMMTFSKLRMQLSEKRY